MKNTTDFWNNFKHSITLKLFTIGFLVLILLIPTGMIKSLVNEREALMHQVVNEVTSKWGNEQTISGPYLVVPFLEQVKVEDEIKEVKQYLHILPEKLNISGEMFPQERYRSIYKVVVYKSMLTFSGHFILPSLENLDISPDMILWEEALINIGIPDMRGINQQIVLTLGEKEYIANPGIKHSDAVNSGVNMEVGDISQQDLHFDFILDINGGKGLYFQPLGKTTLASLSSDWNAPSFGGAFLPDQRKVTEEGFEAEWKVLQLNRNYPQVWVNNAHRFHDSEFGVELIVPVNHYQQTMRSAKYAVMFIVLTFLTFFFIEILKKNPIHTFQYLLVGLALVVFYSLLLALTEHIPFAWAYLIVATVIFVMVSLYAWSVLKNLKTTLMFSGILIIIYTFLYTLLQLMDYALLMGNIGLVIALALVMYFSRKIKWHTEDNPEEFPRLKPVE